MFTKIEPIDWGLDVHLWSRYRDGGDPRLTDVQYWHSMLNDGTESL